ncbi:succinate dehydrogenase, hydrophobic membrane anchor protein [Citromicrobium bathyomarinum]|uniref:succinate dehydrogenase, hydrophobic membrane anchor protein n=1 Tax=Citromicrobium bathyomarinum TaxID=72174 RepID=UPI00315B2A0C
MGNGTSIGRVRGLGSAHEGAHHWLLQRFTAIGNLVLVLFLLVSFLMLPGYDYATVTDWLASPIASAALILLIVSTFWHARLGLQVLIEDYIHQGGSRFALIALLNLVAVAGAVFGIFCIASIAFAGAA